MIRGIFLGNHYETYPIHLTIQITRTMLCIYINLILLLLLLTCYSSSNHTVSSDVDDDNNNGKTSEASNGTEKASKSLGEIRLKMKYSVCIQSINQSINQPKQLIYMIPIHPCSFAPSILLPQNNNNFRKTRYCPLVSIHS